MAAQPIFGNYELLEHILLHLPLRSLLLAQEINKACLDVIQRSSDIHCALWWKSSAPTIAGYREWVRSGEEYCELWYFSGQKRQVNSPIMNPFIILGNSGSGDDTEEVHADGRFVLRTGFTDSKDRGIVCRRERTAQSRQVAGSRHAMLLTHPPVSRLGFDTFPDSDADEAEFTLKSEASVGLTYGAVEEYSNSFCEHESKERREPPLDGRLEGPAASQSTLFAEEGHWWKRVVEVDSTTGFEMLQILNKA